MLGPRLIASGLGGGSFIDRVATVRDIVSDITAADAYVYQLTADNGYEPHTIKIIDDGAGGYVGVAHWAIAAVFQVDVYSSTDLISWTFEATLSTDTALPTIGRRADGSFIVGWQEQSTGRLRLRRYTTLANLLAGTHADNVLLPKTLATGSGVEQVPNFYAVEDPMDIGFAFNDGTLPIEDRHGRGTLTGWTGTGYTSWVTAAQTAVNDAVLALGTFAIGDADEVTYRGAPLTFIEAQTLTGSPAYGAFHIYYWDGSTAVLQPITTHGGSTEHANITVAVVANPSGLGDVLVVGLFLHATGAAPGEAGQAIWYRALP